MSSDKYSYGYGYGSYEKDKERDTGYSKHPSSSSSSYNHITSSSNNGQPTSRYDPHPYKPSSSYIDPLANDKGYDKSSSSSGKSYMTHNDNRSNSDKSYYPATKSYINHHNSNPTTTTTGSNSYIDPHSLAKHYSNKDSSAPSAHYDPNPYQPSSSYTIHPTRQHRVPAYTPASPIPSPKYLLEPKEEELEGPDDPRRVVFRGKVWRMRCKKLWVFEIDKETGEEIGYTGVQVFR